MTEAADVRQRCFGAEFQQQGRGFYVALELFAMVRGTVELGGTPLARDDQPPTFSRRSHDAARRLAAGPTSEPPMDRADELGGAEVADVLGRLFRTLTVPVPGRRTRTPPWQLLHLTPFVGQLVHWDAVVRRRRGSAVVSIEEYAYRGIGAFAHRLLRTDDDVARLDATRAGLAELVSDANTPLGVIARATGARDAEQPKETTNQTEPELGLDTPATAWIELLRSGTHAIVTRQLPREKRVELLMHWVPYAMARHLLAMADDHLGGRIRSLTLDFGHGPNPVRAVSRRHLKDATTSIVDAMDQEALRTAVEHDESESDRRRRWTAPRSFFTGTMAMIGGLNAPTGLQHMTLGLPLLEAVVSATVPRGTQLELARFCEQTLGDKLGLVVDARTAGRRGLLEYANASDFELNAERLAERLRSLGLLQDFSDRTKMVAVPEAV